MCAQKFDIGESTQNLQKNITWHVATVTRERRAIQNTHRSVVLWFTGLSGSGKSTVAHAVEESLYAMGCRSFVLDGDNIRHGLCAGLGFSAEDRSENIRRVSEVTKLFMQAGVVTLTALISPYRKDRELARNVIGHEDFIEIHCRCSLDICEQRDVKGLYRRARSGEIKQFTGISSPYEDPESPDLVLDTGTTTLQECLKQVIDKMVERGIISIPETSRSKILKVEGPFARLPARSTGNTPVDKVASTGYPDFENLVKQVRNNDPAIMDRTMEPDGHFQTRRTTLTEITRAIADLNTPGLCKRSIEDLPTVIFAWGKCRVGSTALTNLFGMAGIPAYYNAIKTAVRHFTLNGPGEAWNVPQRAEHKFVFSKEMSGPYFLADCTVNPLQILVEAGYPTSRIELLVLDRDPYRSLDSWFNKFGDRIPPQRLAQHYVLSALNVTRIKAYAAKVGIRTSHYVYEASRIPDIAITRMFRRLGIEQLYNENVVENWNKKGALASKDSKIIFPPAPEPCTTIGLHASEVRYLYKERSADRVSVEYQALIEQTGVVERYREAAVYCAEELNFSTEDRATVFKSTPLDASSSTEASLAEWRRIGNMDGVSQMSHEERKDISN